ncbi:MAG: DUF4382 domain-containing protein [Candidatus Thermoplasmatota archaeon]|jgi:hypothetical protein|nr:DUF4382 domain-containing protein [Candidatus Thermoplasmatota archaeon]
MRKGALLIMTLAVVMIVIGAVFVYKSYSSNTGLVNFKAADGSMANVSAAYLTFYEISVYSENSKWTNYHIGNVTLNILGRTTSNASEMVTLALGVQNYTMFRVFIQNVTIVYSGKAVGLNVTSSYASVQYSLNVISGSTSSVVFEFNLQTDIDITTQQFTPTIYLVTS